MRITPLATIAKLRIPAFTSLFGDALSVTSMSVVAGGLITLTCASAHGLATGSQDWVSITQALAPNPITALEILDGAYDSTQDGDVQVTTQYPHNLTVSNPAFFASYQEHATLDVPDLDEMTGAIQLVTVIDRYTFVVRPGELTLPDVVPVGSVLLEPLEIEVVGLNIVTATSTTTLTMPTPSTVTRSYTVTSPSIVRNLRMFGAVDFGQAYRHVVDSNPVPGRCYLFICPVRNVRMSRDWGSVSDADYEYTPNAAYRAKLLDGFEIYCFIATQSMAAAVAAMDTAAGEVLRAVMQTFNGIRLPFTEFAERGRYAAILQSHGVQTYDKTVYVHRYTFQAIVTLAAGDTVQPHTLPDLENLDPSEPIPPGGTVPWETFEHDGIYQRDQPQPLLGTVDMWPQQSATNDLFQAPFDDEFA